jgi:[acyl-carrier-protein] S-malonyltransferase
MKVGERLVGRGAIVYPLNLRGPFHSPYMKNAAQQMKTLLQQFEYGEPAFPVIVNQNALPYEKNRENVITNLSQQLVCPLRWQNSLEYLVNRGIKTAVEVGPDKVLKLIAKNNTSSISTYSLENLRDLKEIKEILN